MIDANNVDCYTDSYRLPDGRCIDFSYSKEDSWRNSYTHWYNLLKAHLELHGVNEAPSNLRLRFRLYPKEEFEEILKETVINNDLSFFSLSTLHPFFA